MQRLFTISVEIISMSIKVSIKHNIIEKFLERWIVILAKTPAKSFRHNNKEVFEENLFRSFLSNNRLLNCSLNI